MRLQDVILEDIVQSVAKSVRGKWGRKTETEDIAQELRYEIIRNPKPYQSYIEHNNLGKYYKALHNAATKYAARDVKEYDAVHYPRRYAYTRETVVRNLDKALSYTAADYTPEYAVEETERTGAEETNVLLIDVRAAFKKLPKRSRNALWLRHIKGYTAVEIKDELEISSVSNVYRILWDAVESIVYTLNKP